jgi:hypothetical protein
MPAATEKRQREGLSRGVRALFGDVPHGERISEKGGGKSEEKQRFSPGFTGDLFASGNKEW